MKILYIAGAEYPAPPPKNAIQAAIWVCGQIAEGITKRGHETIYFGGGESTLNVSKNVNSQPAFFDLYEYEKLITADRMVKSKLQTTFQNGLLANLLSFLKDNPVDLIHFHTSPPFFALPFAKHISIPKVFTFHDPLYPQYKPAFDVFAEKNNHYVTISNTQRTHLPELHYKKTIYHGLNINQFQFGEKPDMDMLFFSRITPSKGSAEAIQIAKKTGKKLSLGGIKDLAFKDWLAQDIDIYIDNNQITYLGHIEKELSPRTLMRARLMLFPIQWDEPFGLVMIEAMATGTPVVAFARGSVPEIIQDGVTGFIVNPSDDDIRGDFIIKKTGIEGMCEAVERIYSLSESDYKQMRYNSRKRVEEHFSEDVMIHNYENLYKEILSGN